MRTFSWRKTLLVAALALMALGLVGYAGQAAAAPDNQDSDAVEKETATVVTQYQTYVTVMPAASGGGTRVIAIRFYEDGTLDWNTQFHNNEPPIEEVGVWVDNGDDTVTVTVTGRPDRDYDEPVTTVFQVEGDKLVAVDYDANLWGSAGLELVASVDVLQNIQASLFTIDLAAGFPLDPTFMSVNAGGEVPAALLGAGCNGYINPEPVVTLNWSGEADFLEIFFVSNDDPTLVVIGPDGGVLCNDDAGDHLLDPVIEIPTPVEGVYKIWAGSYHAGHLLPGVLVMTTKPEVNLGTFNLGGLIQRPLLPEAVAEPDAIAGEAALLETLEMALTEAPDLSEADLPVTVDIVADGIVPLFQLPLNNRNCAGLVSGAPSYTFDWQGDVESMRFLFEGDGDSSLLVLGPDLTVACNDDSADGTNQNPVVDVSSPAPGLYAVYVGRINPDAEVAGVLTITDEMTEPAVLAPASD